MKLLMTSRIWYDGKNKATLPGMSADISEHFSPIFLYIASPRKEYFVDVSGTMTLNLFSAGKGEPYSCSIPFSIPRTSLYMKVGFKVPLMMTPLWIELKIPLVISAASKQM